MPTTLLCNLADIANPGARGFELETGNGIASLFIVRREEKVFAYQNRCPHTGIGLQWQPDQFLDIENNFIQCATHGALFTMEKGYCVRGPCVGQSLVSIPLSVSAAGDIQVIDAKNLQEVMS